MAQAQGEGLPLYIVVFVRRLRHFTSWISLTISCVFLRGLTHCRRASPPTPWRRRRGKACEDSYDALVAIGHHGAGAGGRLAMIPMMRLSPSAIMAQAQGGRLFVYFMWAADGPPMVYSSHLKNRGLFRMYLSIFRK